MKSLGNAELVMRRVRKEGDPGLYAEAEPPGFYISAIFWGGRYVEEYCRFCLASLMAPQNIPALSESLREQSRLVVVCPRKEWAMLNEQPLFKQAREWIEPLWLELDAGPEDEHKMTRMSRGHRLISEQAFEDKMAAVYLTPDLMLSDGSLKALEALSRRGKEVVLCIAVRYAEEGCLADFERLGLLRDGEPLALHARTLSEIAVRNLHSETLGWDFEASRFAKQPICPFWRVPGELGIVMFGYSWAPLLVDYRRLANHDTSTFDEWTLDGDYVDRNFGGLTDNCLHVVRDSDEIMLVSFTRESERSIRTPRKPILQVPFVGFATRVALIHELHVSPIMDDLKRRIISRPVFIHGGHMRLSYTNTVERASQIIELATWPSGPNPVYKPPLWRLEQRLVLGVGRFGAQFVHYTFDEVRRIWWTRLCANANSWRVHVISRLRWQYVRYLWAVYRSKALSFFYARRSDWYNLRAHLRGSIVLARAQNRSPFRAAVAKTLELVGRRFRSLLQARKAPAE